MGMHPQGKRKDRDSEEKLLTEISYPTIGCRKSNRFHHGTAFIRAIFPFYSSKKYFAKHVKKIEESFKAN